MPQRYFGVRHSGRVRIVEPMGMSLSNSSHWLENWKRKRGVEFSRDSCQPNKSDPEKLKAKI